MADSEKNPYMMNPYVSLDDLARATLAVAWELGKLREMFSVTVEEEELGMPEVSLREDREVR